MSYAPEDPVQHSTETWIRVLQIILNFILSLLGKGGVTVSTMSKIGYFNDLKLLDHYQSVNFNVFLACSAILSAIGWMGVFAGSKNCHKSTLTNGVLLSAFVVATTAYAATMGVITDYTPSGGLYKEMKREMLNYNKHTHIIDSLQTTLSCCGLNDLKTWNASNIPKSCCGSPEIGTQCVVGPNLHTNGCFKEFIRTSRYYAWILFTILAACGLLEILGVVLSRLQCRIINDRNKKKLAREELVKIPRPHVTQSEETEQEEKEQEDKQKEIKEEENKDVEQSPEKSEEAGSSEKKEDLGKEESNTCRNICKDLTNSARVNIDT